MNNSQVVFTGAALMLLAAPGFHARSYPVNHPVFPVDPEKVDVGKLRAETEQAMAFTPAQIDELLVARTTFYNVDCPNCEGGNPSRAERWIWSIDDPDHIKCKFCGMVFPNDNYPLDKEDRITDSTGEVHSYRYWEGEAGYKHYLQMRIDNCKKRYIEGMAKKLASLYAATGEDKYARQAALILNRVADVYPHYSPHGVESWGTMATIIYEIQPPPVPEDGLWPVPTDGSGYNRFPPLGKAIYPYCSARWGDSGDNWFYAEMPYSLALAYDRIAPSSELDKLSEELGEDVPAKLEDFFRQTANFARTFPVQLGNMTPKLCRAFAVIGRVIGEPEFVHDAFRRIWRMLEVRFYPDGIWREGTPAYHNMTMGGLVQCTRVLKGYSDPEGYVNPIDGLHLENTDPDKDLPFLAEAQAAVSKLKLPTGHYAAIHDSWAQTSLGRSVGRPKDTPLKSHLLWGYGHAILGLGAGELATQAHLHFSGWYGHGHEDNLSLLLYSHGKELLPDLGYTHTDLRPFTMNSLAHNVAVVDGKRQQARATSVPADGYLVSYAVLGDLLRYAEAGAEGAYPGVTKVYRRAIAVVGLPQGGSYVLDIFRITGGSKHDWVIHGSADEDQALSVSIPSGSFSGRLMPPGIELPPGWPTSSLPKTIEGYNAMYGLFDDRHVGPGDETFSATFSYPQEDSPKLQTTILGQPETVVYIGTLPSVRRAAESNEKAWDFRMPALLLRREGEKLDSIFAAVHLPYQGAPPLQRITRLELEDAPAGAIGLICEGNGFTDYHLCGPDPEGEMKAAGIPLSARARYAFVRTSNDQVTRMALVDGTGVRFGEQEIALPPPASGEILAVHRQEAGDAEDALIVDADLQPRLGLPDERVIVRFGNGMTYGLAISEIRREGENSVIVLTHRPGFKLAEDGEGAVMTYFPHKKSPRRPQFRLQNIAVLTTAPL